MTDQELNQHRAERADRDRAAVAVKAMSSFVNLMGFGGEQFVAQMAREHRTLQQCFTGLMILWLRHLATLTENQYDARNQGSVELAKKLVGSVEEWELHLPCT